MEERSKLCCNAAFPSVSPFKMNSQRQRAHRANPSSSAHPRGTSVLFQVRRCFWVPGSGEAKQDGAGVRDASNAPRCSFRTEMNQREGEDGWGSGVEPVQGYDP